MGASWGGGRAEQVVMDAQLGWGMARARAVLTGQSGELWAAGCSCRLIVCVGSLPERGWTMGMNRRCRLRCCLTWALRGYLVGWWEPRKVRSRGKTRWLFVLWEDHPG